MAKRGVWGERMTIIIPILYKRVSCATCVHYCHEDHSCMASPIIPKINGFDYWKKCKKFELSQDYLDEAHKEQVIRVKGDCFFKQNRMTIEQEENNQRIEDEFIIPVSKQVTNLSPDTKQKTFSERFIVAAKNKHGLTFEEILMPEFPGLSGAKCYINLYEKLIVMTMPKIKSKKVRIHHNIDRNYILTDLWTRFVESLRIAIKTLIDLKVSYEYEKWIVIPVIPYKEDESCGETFYKTKGYELKGIKLVEMDETSNLLFATGPVFEKYWTAEKIRNIQIFKD